MAEDTQFYDGEASPNMQEQTGGFFSSLNFKIPTSPTVFMEMYGWYLLAAFLFYYFLWDSIKDKVLSTFPKSSNNISQIPPQNDMRLHEIRAKQQQRLDKIAKINQEKKDNKNEKSETKLSKEQQQIKNSSAYRFATTGQWGKDDDKGSGGLADAQSLPRYRAPSAFQRHGRRPGGGGGG
eukprot:779631_1